MSFASEPGREDGNLPPVNIVIPDDARELERDVIAYRREQRARRRRQRITRVFGPLGGRDWGGHAAILPLIATCVALSMLAGAMLSVITISPASAPTLARSPGTSAAVVPEMTGLTTLPIGTVRLDGDFVPVNSLKSSAIALIPAGCGCGPALSRLAAQAAAARAGLYFVASGTASAQLTDLTNRYGGGTAKPVYDTSGVLGAAYRPVGLTVLLVYSDATAQVRRDLPPGFQLTPDLRELNLTGQQAVG